MHRESARDSSGDHRRQDQSSAGEAASDKGHSGSTHSLLAQKTRFRWLKNWAAAHKGEIFWGLLFAWVMARFVFPPDHKPYYVRVVEYSGIDEPTERRFKELEKEWLDKPPMLGDVPVQLDVVKLAKPETAPGQQEAEVEQKAKDLASDMNTLMVVGHLPSGLTKKSLPTYMRAQPPVLYIATTASADKLCENCGIPGFLPWLQPSPTNTNEAMSMILFAAQREKKHCLVVTDQNPAAADYSNELGADLGRLDGFRDVKIVDTYKMGSGSLPDEQYFQKSKPDCVLYAGHMGTAVTLWNLLRGRNLLVILSDGVIETRVNDTQFDKLPSDLAFFTYATDAADAQNSLYAEDAVVGIARQLLEDLNSRGGDIWYRLRSLVHFETGRSARKNLVRIMKENSRNRTWYRCSAGPDGFCIFDGNQRENALFHVWQPDTTSESRMKDIDGWHPPKDSSNVIHRRQKTSAR